MFKKFGLSEKLNDSVKEAGFTKPSDIQDIAIPLILEGHDIIGQAKTGTGKTAAFALPCLNKISPKSTHVELLIITPTRELANQVCEETQRFANALGFQCVAISGGSSYARQIEGIKHGAKVVVATPGRLLDLLNSKRIPKLTPSMVVLDEADEMLDMGFLEDIQAIFNHLPENRQTLMFSATMPPPIQKLAKKILKSPKHATTQTDKVLTNQDITQHAYMIDERERKPALLRLIDAHKPTKLIIFCRTRLETDQLYQALSAEGYSVGTLHGDLEQRQRERVILRFRNSDIEILTATDVAARGLSISDVSHVINYHLPMGSDNYVHRIGRTGRAGQKGTALTLVTPGEIHKFRRMQEGAGKKINPQPMPTAQDIKNTRLSELGEQLKNTSTNNEAKKFLDKLKTNLSESELSLKLLSLFLEQLKVAGPDKMGHSPESFENMKSERSGRNSSGGRNRRFGGGGGGGRDRFRGRPSSNSRSGRGGGGGQGGGGFKGRRKEKR